MTLRRGCDDNICEPGRVAFPSGLVGQDPGDAGDANVKREDAIAIEMQQRLKLRRQAVGFARRSFTPRLGDPVFNLRNRHRRQEKHARLCVHPGDQIHCPGLLHRRSGGDDVGVDEIH